MSIFLTKLYKKQYQETRYIYVKRLSEFTKPRKSCNTQVSSEKIHICKDVLNNYKNTLQSIELIIFNLIS